MNSGHQAWFSRMLATVVALVALGVRPALSGLVREARFPAEGALVRPVVGATFSVPSFDGETVSIKVASRNVSTTGIVTYGGRTPGSWLNNATVVVAKGGVVATVTDEATGHVFFFRREEDVWIVRETTPSRGGQCGAAKSLPSEPAPSAEGVRLMASTPLTGNPLVDGAKIMKHGETVTNVIDVLVGVDRSAGNWIRQRSQFAGMEDAVNLFAADAIARCNSTYANTDLDKLFTFNLVGVIEVGVDCSQLRDWWWGDVDVERILDDLALGGASGAYGAAYREVREKREAVCADIVSFLVACGEDEAEGTVGISFSLEDRTIMYEATSDVAYNVCLVEVVATGTTMAHEIGHIMGAGHADMKDKGSSGPQLYGYSSGYYFTVTNADVALHGATVMSYSFDGFEGDYAWQGRWGPPPENVDPYSEGAWLWNNGRYTETEFFSSPNHTYKYTRLDGLTVDTGVPLGDATHDNTRLLSLTYPLVANYRARKCSLAVVAPEGGGKSLSGSGMYAFGATATLAATPDADHVFAGWYHAYDEATGTFSEPAVSSDGADSRSPSIKFVLPSEPATGTSGAQFAVYARFVDRATDAASLAVELQQAYRAGRDGSFSLDLGACVESLSLPKLAVSGLPSGVKYDAKTLAVKGTATKPGVYTVKVSATNASVKKATTASTGAFQLKVPNITTEMFQAAGLVSDGTYLLWAGIAPDLSGLFEALAADRWKLAVSGLPSGVKYDSKNGKLTGVAAKEGAYTVYFTATRGTEKQIATATFEVKFPEVTLRTAAWRDTSAGGTVTGGGKYPFGKKVTLKATPAKGSVFMGWRRIDDATSGQGREWLSQAASYSHVATDEDVTFAAVFATKEEDTASLKVVLADVTSAEGGAVELDLGACVESLSLPKLAVSGLPSGVKYDAKTLAVKGKATKPGVYTVKVSATNTSVKKATSASTGTFTLTVPNFTCAALPNLKPETDAYGVVRCGVRLDAGLIDCSPAEGWTVKVAGLPAGLKYDAKKGWITGVPTAKAGAYTVTFTASKKGAASQVATITLNVAPLPTWAVGTFDGCVWGAGAGSACPNGLVTLTVAASGKVSGKVADTAGTWTLSAASFDSSDEDRDAYEAMVTAKSGKLATTNVVTLRKELATVSSAGTAQVVARGVVSGMPQSSATAAAEDGSPPWTAWQNLWKTEPWKTIAKPFAKAPALAIDAGTRLASPYPGTITFKFEANGVVKASGKFVTGRDARGKEILYSATCSAVLIPEIGESYRIFLFFPPKAGTFNGFADEFFFIWDGFIWDDEVLSSPSDLDKWLNENPDDEDDDT